MDGLIHEVRHGLDYVNKTASSTEGIGGDIRDAGVPKIKDVMENRGTRTENVVAKEYNDIVKSEMKDAWARRDANPDARARYNELRSESELYKGPIMTNSKFRGN